MISWIQNLIFIFFSLFSYIQLKFVQKNNKQKLIRTGASKTIYKKVINKIRIKKLKAVFYYCNIKPLDNNKYKKK